MNIFGKRMLTAMIPISLGLVALAIFGNLYNNQPRSDLTEKVAEPEAVTDTVIIKRQLKYVPPAMIDGKIITIDLELQVPKEAVIAASSIPGTSDIQGISVTTPEYRMGFDIQVGGGLGGSSVGSSLTIRNADLVGAAAVVDRTTLRNEGAGRDWQYSSTYITHYGVTAQGGCPENFPKPYCGVGLVDPYFLHIGCATNNDSAIENCDQIVKTMKVQTNLSE